jgi:hypothetical protein
LEFGSKYPVLPEKKKNISMLKASGYAIIPLIPLASESRSSLTR